MTEFEKQIARIFCGGCNLYVEKSQSCCYADDSGKDKFCNLPLNKLKELFALRSLEGYRLAIIDNKECVLTCGKGDDKLCHKVHLSQPCPKCEYGLYHYKEVEVK